MMMGATAISRQTELVAAASLRLRELDSADNCALATTPIDKLPPRWERMRGRMKSLCASFRSQRDRPRSRSSLALRHTAGNDRLNDRRIERFIVVQADGRVEFRACLHPFDDLVRASIPRDRGV